MKQYLSIFIALILCLSQVNAQIVVIPDANFKSYLVGNASINTNGDSEIQLSEAEAHTGTINVSGQNIADLTGIEAFTNITQLYCSGNQLNHLDVSSNVNLTYLQCNTSQLTGLDISANIHLHTLQCANNQITSLNISNNHDIAILWCQTNPLTVLNAQNGNNNNFTSFNSTSTPNLTCIQVDDVNYSNANWTNIDATASFSTNCNFDYVVYIPDSIFKAELVGNATINTNGDTEIQVTEAQAYAGSISVANKNIASLAGIQYFTNITELYCGSNQLSYLDLSKNINLSRLDCDNNLLYQLKLETNTQLTQLNCNNNQIHTLDCSNNTQLTQVNCSNNQISSLDFHTASGLTQLDCSDNQLTAVYLFGNTNLTQLLCQNNQLNFLDLALNTSLTDLNCSNNQLADLNVQNGNNNNFTAFDATNNANLSCIQVDNSSYSTTNWTNIDATSSFNTNCNFPHIVYIPDPNFKGYLLANTTTINTNSDTEIQVTEAQALIGTLDVSGQQIKDLTGIEAFTGLTYLSCRSNELSSLDVSSNINLNHLDCGFNQIKTLDVTALTGLTVFACDHNELETSSIVPNINLTQFFCQNNKLKELNIQNGNNTNLAYFGAANNDSLTCIQVDDVSYATTNWANTSAVDAGVSFSANCYLNNPTIVADLITLTAYPNPTHKSLNLNLDKEYQSITIQLSNNMGQTVMINQYTQQQAMNLNLEQLAKGLYFVTVQTEEGTATLKVIKE